MSTPVPLTVIGFATNITLPLCCSASFCGWRTKSFSVRKGPITILKTRQGCPLLP